MLKKKNQKQEEEQLGVRLNLLSFYLFFLLLFFPLQGFSSHFSFTPRCIEAHELCYALNLDSAQILLENEIRDQSDNLAPKLILHLAHTLRALITEEASDIERMESFSNLVRRDFLQLNANDPYKRFALSEMALHSALINAKENKQIASAHQLRVCLKLLRQNENLFPSFTLNKKTLGLLNCYLSTIPDNFKWAVELLGFEGNLDKGLEQLKSVTNLADPKVCSFYPMEASMLLSFSLAHVAKEADKAWAEALSLRSSYPKALLPLFIYSNVGMKFGKNDQVIEALKDRPNSPYLLPFHLLEHMLGTAKLRALDTTAIVHLKMFEDQFHGVNYIKSNYEKMSWYCLIFNKQEEYTKYRMKISSSGNLSNEEDQAAQSSTSKQTPNLILLKTRLLYDGGYYSKARELILPFKAKDFQTDQLKAEYAYRKARIYEALGQMKLAILFYELCTKLAIDSPEYYGAYACLYLGDHYLKNGDLSNAKRYYSKARTFKNNKEYTAFIEYRSKQGINACRMSQ